MGSRLKYTHFPSWFVVACLVYLLVRIVRWSDIEIPEFINSYLTDFLCLPIILLFCLMAVRFLKRDSTLKLNFFHIAIVCVEFILVFEVIMPRFSSIYTADFIDVLMYTVGGICFYFLQTPRKEKSFNN